MNEEFIKIRYNPKLMINEIKNLPLLMKEEDNNISIYKFIIHMNNNGLAIKAMVNESLIETLNPMRELVEKISCEIIDSYDLYSLNLEMNTKSNINLFSLDLEFKQEKRFNLIIVLNPDYVHFFDGDSFNENNILDTYIIKFNEAFNNILLKVYEFADDFKIPIIKTIKESYEYELIFKRNENNEWTYHTFVRTMIKPIQEQEKDIDNIIHSSEYKKITKLLNNVPHSNLVDECFIKLNYDGDNISNVLYNINN